MTELNHESKETFLPSLTLRALKDIITNILPTTSRKHNQNFQKPLPIGAVASPLFINSGPKAENNYDEVLKNVYLGDRDLALDKGGLRQLSITHILNAAQGKKFNQIDTDSDYYSNIGIKFMGVRAMDFPNFKMQPYFAGASDYIAECLDNEGKLYIHCQQGLSRSATLVLAYMMIKRNIPLVKAVSMLRKTRPVLPNDGFLKQLIHLNEELFPKVATTQSRSLEELGVKQELVSVAATPIGPIQVKNK